MIQIETYNTIKKFRLGRTILGRGLYFTAAYFVDGLLIDSGCAYTVDALVKALDGSIVKTVVNTHSHEDHVAANAYLKKKYSAQILAHELALPVLVKPGAVRLRPYQHVLWGRPMPSHAEPIGDTIETDRYKFQVIHTPGHSPDHVCLFEPNQGWLFVGDAYVGGRDRALRADYNIWQIIASLKKLCALEASVLFAGSGSVREGPKFELQEKIRYLEEIGAKVLELRNKGLHRNQINNELFGHERAIFYYTLGNFSGRNLVRSYIEDTA
jgi:glyoxylase-like metal-dependent hydrolase (beta-lactamase superfamily II)